MVRDKLRDKERELDSLKEIFRKSKEPGSYLVRTLEDKEKVIISVKKEIYTIKKENASLKTKLEFLHEKYNKSISKMADLELRKNDIEKIKKLILQMTHEQIEDRDLFYEVKKINDKMDVNHVDLDATLYKKTNKMPRWSKKLKKRK